MYRSPHPTELKPGKASIRCLILAAIAMAVVVLSSPVLAQSQLPRLFSVEIGGAEYVRGVAPALRPNWGDDIYKDLTVLAIPKPVFNIIFEENETFRFILPISILSDGGDFGSLGSTEYSYTLTYADGSTTELTFPMPNKLIRIRDALLAGEKFWNDAIAHTSMRFELLVPGEPIDVFISFFSEETASRAGAYAQFFQQQIRIPQDIPDRNLETTTLHELFHFVTHALLRNESGDKRGYLNWNNNSQERARLFLFESTARWSEDEPITIPPGPGRTTPFHSDAGNRYYCFSFIRNYATDLFARNQYCAGLLIKYFTEQVAGGSDNSTPEVVLELIARAYRNDRNSLSPDGWIRALAEGLPPERFPRVNWQERWQNFYTSFAATLVVQNASLADAQSQNRLGIHDDGLSHITQRPKGQWYWPRHYEDYLNSPTQTWSEPAEDDAERMRRLATIAETVEVEAYASRHYRLDTTREYGQAVGPRSVFVYAGNTPHTGTFLLHRREPQNRNNRYTPFTRIENFALTDGNNEIVDEQTNLGEDQRNEDILYVGLVNTGPPKTLREMRWAYVTTPRFIPNRGSSQRTRTPTIVHFVGGSAFDRGDEYQFYTGDTFVFEIVVTSKVHLGSPTRTYIPEHERTINLAMVCGENNEPVTLSTSDSESDIRIDVTEVPSSRRHRPASYRYRFSGRIDPENKASGDCKVRFELTSLLNLGGGDRQIDESFTLRLDDSRPVVERVQVISDGTVVYDSAEGILLAVKPENGTYRMGLKVWFSTELSEDGASIIAGLREPYDAYEIPANTNYSDVPFWSTWSPTSRPYIFASMLETELTIPESDAPNGGFVYFSISAASEVGVLLDTEPNTPGDQRDTQHFAMLDIDDYYLATLSTQTQFEGRVHDVEYQSVYRPFKSQLRLVPVEHFDRDRFLDNYHPLWARKIQAMEIGLGNARRFLDDNQSYLDNFAPMVETMGEQLPPEMKVQFEMMQTRAVDLALVVAQWEQALARVREVEGDYRLLVSFIKSYRTYECDEERMGPVPGRFGGMEGWRHLRRVGDTSVYETYSEYAAPGWLSRDVSNIAWRNVGGCPRLETLQVIESDYRRITALASNPPTLSLNGMPNTSGGSGNPPTLSLNGSSNISGGSAPLVADHFRTLSLNLDYAAHVAFDIAKRFDVSGQTPVGMTENEWTERFRSGSIHMPTLPDGLLVRVQYYLLGWPFPVDGEGAYLEQRTGEAPYREDRAFTFSTRYEPQSDRLDSYYHLTGGDGPDHPKFLPRGAGDDMVELSWQLEAQTGIQITSKTHAQHFADISPDNQTIVILAQAPEKRIAGSLSLNFDFTDPPFAIEQGRSKFSWQFAYNGTPQSQDMTEPTDPPISSNRENEEPDNGQTEIDENGEDEEPSAEEPDNRDGRDVNATDDSEPEETPVPPDEKVSPSRGWPAQTTLVPPTIQYPGVVQGIISNGSISYEPGHVAVYLTGDNLPPLDGEPLQMELNAGFPQSFVGIPAGSSIRFRNGEGEGSPHYYIFTDSDLAQIDHVIYPGEEAVIPFPDEGRLTVRTRNNTAHVLEIVVLPSTRFNVLNTASYIIRDVPPGAYMLTAITENRRYQPFSTMIEVPAVGWLSQDFTLFERGTGIAALAAE